VKEGESLKKGVSMTTPDPFSELARHYPPKEKVEVLREKK